MSTSFRSLHTLPSIRPDDIPHLASLGINNLGDLLSFQPIRIATHVRAAAEGFLRPEEILPYLDNAAHATPPRDLLQGSVEAIKGIGQALAASLSALGIRTIDDLADYAPFTEAEELVATQTSEQRDPFAPACVLPTCRKFTRHSKSFVSFFRQQELRDLSLRGPTGSTHRYDASRIAELFTFGTQEQKVVYLGYSVSFLQEWVYGGVHLGEPQGSVNLFMGQDTQVSMLDWRRAMSALRREDSRVSERLSSTLFHQRAVDEVARATAEEHQFGATSTFGANAATAGSFVAAGAIVGGIGGGISGALIGSAAAGVGAAPGAIIGTAVGSVAGAAAGSLIVAGATTLGFVETDARGAREVFATSAQNIQQHTVQNSSSLRSFWSNIISQSVQEEQQAIRTDRVTNHNRIHALNALYFEVLNEYRVTMQVQDHAPILFLPFKPFHFTEETLRRYWWLLRTAIDDKALVLSLDTHFLALRSDPSPAGELAELPAIEDIETSEIVVEVNLDGSAMESLLAGLVDAVFLGAAIAAFRIVFDASKREQVEVHLETTDGTIRMTRANFISTDPNFVGQYRTTRRIPIAEITGVKITNANAEFVLDLVVTTVDVNELAFEGVTARLTVRNRASFRDALPTLGSLEAQRTIRRTTFRIGSNRSTTIPWDVADRLRDQFEGVDSERSELEAEVNAEELVAAKIANLIGFLNANKFGFTRFILQNTEIEQVTSVLEGVRVGGVPLSSLAGTTPLGFCGNHVVLPLRNVPGAPAAAPEVDSRKLQFHLSTVDDLEIGDRAAADAYMQDVKPSLAQFISDAQGAVQPGAAAPIGLATALQLQSAFTLVEGMPQPNARTNDLVRQIQEQAFRAAVQKAASLSRALLLQLQTPPVEATNDLARLQGYFAELEQLLGGERGRIISSDAVSLPSPAVFMEPVLSNAKGAELYDMRRNSHYEILQAPGIGTADPNVSRSQEVTLAPNVPGSTLSIQAAPNLPLPNSLTAALAEAGKLELSKLISTNAETLQSTVSDLTSLATELAKASATLTGDAQKQVLEAAGNVTKQLNDVVAKSLQAPAAPKAEAKPSSVPAPPKTQQEKAEVARELERIKTEPGTPAEKAERKRTIGASVVPAPASETRDYQMSILFLGADGEPFRSGDFRLSMSFFELGRTFPINNGAPIQMQDGEFLFPDLFSLQSGRRATITIDADMASTNIRGIANFTLPDRTDLVFTCRMQTETRRVTQTDIRTAVDEAVRTSSFGVGLNPVLTSFLNAGVAFPFKIFRISADSGAKVELDLRAEYNNSSTSSSGTTTGSTTVTEFEVVVPKNTWSIEVN